MNDWQGVWRRLRGGEHVVSWRPGVGLARSAAALSEVLVESRDYPRALERLAESITLTSEKGVRTGLELNLASLRSLDGRLPFALHDAARGLERRVRQALGGDARARASE